MSDQYFTPEIEDLHIGYECEVDLSRLPGISQAWVLFTIKSSKEIVIRESHGDTIYRTPYLTKEQIEAEGWGKGTGLADFEKTKPELYSAKRVNHVIYYLVYHFETKFLSLKDSHQKILYEGPCKDINTFRFISKLLGI